MFDLGETGRCDRARAAAALVLFAPLLAAGQATLGAKGDTIHGRVADLTADGVVFEPASGKGQITVKWDDVQSLETEGSYTVLHGDEGEARGRILGFEGGKVLLVGDAPATAQRVEIGTLFHAYDESKATGSWVERMRSRLRFWMATLDASAAYTNSTTDTVVGAAGFLIDRKKAPTHLLFEGGARYADEDEQHEDAHDHRERAVRVRARRARPDRSLVHLRLVALHPRQRAAPLAARRAARRRRLPLHQEQDARTSPPTSASRGSTRTTSATSSTHDRDRATTRGSDDFWAIAFGAQGDAVLAYGAILRGRAEYLPAVDDWQDDYLARAETSLDVPMLDWLAFRLAFADEYDNTPAPGAQRNKFTTTAGLAIRFIPLTRCRPHLCDTRHVSGPRARRIGRVSPASGGGAHAEARAMRARARSPADRGEGFERYTASLIVVSGAAQARSTSWSARTGWWGEGPEWMPCSTTPRCPSATCGSSSRAVASTRSTSTARTEPA